MHETALSRQDAIDAGVRLRVVECASGLCIEVGNPEDNRYDMEQVLRLVWLALENARKGVTVNCIAPGYIDTEMVGAMDQKVLDSIVAQIPVGRLGKGEEIADMVSWLSGERAGYVTGCTLSLNGGQYLVG